jgi:DNA/RNA endonuclease YhcR with UshA esterase domain
MSTRTLLSLIIVLLLSLAACQQPPVNTPEQPISETPTQAPQPTETPAPILPKALISEVLAGVQGNNNFDFIELYNPGSVAPFNLKGASLWYQLADGKEETLVYQWDAHTLIPPQGHYLLARSGEDFGLVADALIDVPLVPQRGSLQIRSQAGEVLDSLTWGDGSQAFTEGEAALTMQNGVALERVPGGEAGNASDENRNDTDFSLNDHPDPQNSGSLATPLSDGYLSISVDAPAVIEPGQPLEYLISVSNQTNQDVKDLSVQVPLPLAFEIQELAAGMGIADHPMFWDLPQIEDTHQILFWPLDSLAAGETQTAALVAKAPWTYLTAVINNYSVQTADGLQVAFGSPVYTEVAGGAIPIGIARGFANQEIVVEGVATMYTGGYFAGGGNTKFYIEDETGGIQVWVDDGEGDVTVNLGDRVRVQGILLVYRGAMELAPTSEGVEVLEKATDSSRWPGTQVPLEDAVIDMQNLPGRLVQTQGTVARLEEFSYSYELDLVDEAGHLLSVYIDKLTNINVDAITSGETYQISGVIEVLDANQRMYPRIQEDLSKIYPPQLYLEISAPHTIRTGEAFVVQLTATNHTDDVLEEVVISAPYPRFDLSVERISHDGIMADEAITWTIPELEGGGGTLTVEYEALPTTTGESIRLESAALASADGVQNAESLVQHIFLQGSVPIWAIQGEGDRSAYLFENLTTVGVVSGVFPELGGFWLQSLEDDKNPATSEGLFVNFEELEISVLPGDWLEVSGVVQETYQQTQIVLESPDDIQVLSSGHSLPAPVELNPPLDAALAESYYESLEGMFVQLTEPAVAVAPTNHYGEYALVRQEHDVARLWQGGENGMVIIVDDGSSQSHDNRSTMAYAINVGDQVSNLVGPLAYTFGQFKIEAVTVPAVTTAEVGMSSLPALESDEFSLMSWNVENLFDFKDPHPSSPEMPTIGEYKISISKVANTILAAGSPTVVGLQEVENIGVLEDIAEHEALAAFAYQPVLIEGSDSRGIDVGYLVRGDRAEVSDVQQFDAPEGLTSRPPLMLEVSFAGDSVFVLNNHFTSMSGGEAATEPRRDAQAAWNVSVTADILAQNPDAYLAVIGDLNSYYDAKPIDTLRAAGLLHVFEMLPGDERYTYIYQGASQVLDHILVTPELMDLLRRVDILHLNADFALSEPGDESPLRASDHDPVIAVFSLSP